MPKLRPHGTALGGALNSTQRQLLLHDEVFIEIPGEDGFHDAQQARTAWRAHRGELFAEFGDRPGMRPAGYWRFDIGIDPPVNWWQELEQLEQRGLLSKDEEFRLEHERKELAADQGAFCDALFMQRWNPYMYQRFEQQFAFASGWHARRGRTELQAKYEHLAAVASEELERAKV